MELMLQQSGFDDAFVEFDSWYQDVTTRRFYADDSLFSDQGHNMQNVKSIGKLPIKSYPSLLPLPDTMDALVPEYEISHASLSCSSSDEIPFNKQQLQKNNSWDAYFSKHAMVRIPSEDSVSQLSSFAPEIQEENETFRDLTELLEQEYPLSRSSQGNSTRHELHNLEVPVPCNSVLTQSDDSQHSLIGSFAVDLSPESPPKPGDKRYKEMRRKNNIASKNARVARREKEQQMEERAKQLETDNHALRIKVRKMEELAQELKTKLIQSVTRNK